MTFSIKIKFIPNSIVFSKIYEIDQNQFRIQIMSIESGIFMI